MKLKYIALIIAGFFVVIAASCGSAPTSNGAAAGKTLDQAVEEAAQNIEARLEAGTKVAALSFDSPSGGLSEYVLEELSGYLVNGGKLVVLERSQLDAVRAELDFNLTDEVADKSAQEAGRMLGAQYIITGSFQEDVSRIRFKTIVVESAGIAASSSADVVSDSKMQRLLASKAAPVTPPSTVAAVTPPPVAAASPVVTPPPAATAGPQNGTYTFYPRLRANQGGVDKDIYVDRIVIRNNYLTIYMVDTPVGKSNRYNPEGNWGGDTQRSTVLKDLNSNLTWNVANTGRDTDTDGFYLTFLRVTTSRFSLANNNPYPTIIFDEIVLANPR
jgi:TolB-like protein